MAPEPSNARLRAVLRPFQRRLRLRSFVRHLPITAATALAAATIGVWFTGAVTALVAAVLLAVASAVALAFIRTPSIAATATIVDRELRLQDRTVSALQFSETDDPVARLVVREAISRLQSQKTSDLRVTAPRRASWLVSAAAVLFAIGFIAQDRPSTVSGVPPHGGGAVATSRGVSQRSGATGPTTAPALAGDAPQTHSAPESAESTPQARQSATERTAERAAADEAKGSNASAGKTLASAPAPGSAEERSRSTQTGGGTSNDAGQGAMARAAASEPSGQGRGAGGAGGREGGAGGVGAGELASGNPAHSSAAPPSIPDRRAASYAAAYARAESATAAERVPVRLRPYVRAYFLSIRPGS